MHIDDIERYKALLKDSKAVNFGGDTGLSEGGDAFPFLHQGNLMLHNAGSDIHYN